MLIVISGEASRIEYKMFDEPETKTTQESLNALKEKLAPKINIRYERYIYNGMKQLENKSYQEYLIKLKTLILLNKKLCRYV